MNCLLIEMGEMACYQERCPDCGRIPPGRKKAKPPDLFKKLVGKRLSTRKPSKSRAMMMMEAGIRTNQLVHIPDSLPQLQNGQGYPRQVMESMDLSPGIYSRTLWYDQLLGRVISDSMV